MGKEVWIVNPDPLPAQLDYLAADTKFRVFNGGALPSHDVAVTLDFCELSRTGPMKEPLVAAPSKKLVIDHHLFQGEPWWNAAYVDCRASATGLLVYRIARELGQEIDLRIARAVYTSIVTDTGWFKYSNTDAETLAVAADLVAHGVNPAQMYSSIYQRNSSEQPLGVARALSRLRYEAKGRIAIVDLPLAKSGEADLADGDDVLDLVRAVARVEVVLFVRETSDGKVKLSARSKTDFDVNRLARGFGGGGHAKASGATMVGPLDDACRRLVEAAVAQLDSAPGTPR